MEAEGENEEATTYTTTYTVSVDIAHRYARTEVKCRKVNDSDQNKDAEFKLILPPTAYITHFQIDTGGKTAIGHISDTKSIGNVVRENKITRTVKLSQHIGKENQEFEVKIEMAAKTDAVFVLAYEELLDRRSSFYGYFFNIPSDPTAADLDLNICVQEYEKILRLHVPEIQPHLRHRPNGALLQRKEQEDVRRRIFEEGGLSTGHICWRTNETFSLTSRSQFVLLYSLDFSASRARLLFSENFFLTFVTGDQMECRKKEIVFLVDISSAMEPNMKYVKDALAAAVGKLSILDRFNVITFGDPAEKMEEVSLLASHYNLETIISRIYEISTFGEAEQPDLRGALIEADKLLSRSKGEAEQRSLFVVVLTNYFESTHFQPPFLPECCLEHSSDYTVFCIGFGGQYVDYNLLHKISNRTVGGFTGKILEEKDIEREMEAWMEEILSPVLADLDVEIRCKKGSEGIKVAVPERDACGRGKKELFRGRESVVAGRFQLPLHPTSLGKIVGVASGKEGLERNATVAMAGKMMSDERLKRIWAYLTLRKIESKFTYTVSPTMDELDQAEQLCSEFGFLAIVSDMAVVEMDEENRFCVWENIADKGESHGTLFSGVRKRMSPSFCGPSPLGIRVEDMINSLESFLGGEVLDETSTTVQEIVSEGTRKEAGRERTKSKALEANVTPQDESNKVMWAAILAILLLVAILLKICFL